MADMTAIAASALLQWGLSAIAAIAAGFISVQIRNKAMNGGDIANMSLTADLPPPLWLLQADVRREDHEAPLILMAYSFSGI